MQPRERRFALFLNETLNAILKGLQQLTGWPQRPVRAARLTTTRQRIKIGTEPHTRGVALLLHRVRPAEIAITFSLAGGAIENHVRACSGVASSR